MLAIKRAKQVINHYMQKVFPFTWFLTNITLINDNQCTLEWRCLLQIFSNRFVSGKLSQYVLGVHFLNTV